MSYYHGLNFNSYVVVVIMEVALHKTHVDCARDNINHLQSTFVVNLIMITI
jgi:hypothetical protein